MTPAKSRTLGAPRHPSETENEVGAEPLHRDPSGHNLSDLRKRVPARAIAGAVFFLSGAALGVVGAYRIYEMGSRSSSPDLMAVVAGTPITRGQFNHQMEVQEGGNVLKTMIAEEMMLQFARQRNLLPTDATVQERVRSVRANASFEREILGRSLTPAELTYDCRIQLIQEAIQGSDEPVSEKEILDYYRGQCDPRSPSSKFYSPETAHVSIIVTATEEEGRAAEMELRRGQPFAEVARARSKDRTATAGGDAPAVIRGRSVFSRLDPEFESDVFRLSPGEWTQPRRVGNSKFWMLVKCNRKEPAKTIPLGEVKEQCRRQVAALKAARSGPTKLATEFEEFRRRVPVEVFWEPYYYDLTGRKAKGGSGSQ
jgi:hypothetical protein